MTLEEIKFATRNGKTVYWGNLGYVVTLHTFKDGTEQWLIKCLSNDHCSGLTWQDGKTMNGKETEFFILEDGYTYFNKGDYIPKEYEYQNFAGKWVKGDLCHGQNWNEFKHTILRVKD